MSPLTAWAHDMIDPAQPLPPTCKRCGRFLRTAEEREQAYCARCPPPTTAPADQDERFCCASDPPCPSCPYVIGWD